MASPFGGGVKFFNKSRCLYADGATISTTSGSASAQYALDRNIINYWRSSGSSDAVTETIEVTLPSSYAIDSIFLVDHNFKSYNIQYDAAGVWTHFASVSGLDASLGNITETVFADDTSYYEFTEVTTNKIRIQVTTTQVVNAQKYINQIIVTKRLGTLNGFPKIKGTFIDRGLRKNEMLSGKVLIQKSEESFGVELNFDNYPAHDPYDDDVTLMFTLHDLEENFIIWLCGGRRGTSYFKNQMRGYRLKDVYTVQLTAPLKPIYSNNVFQSSVDLSAKFEEAVD